MKIKFSILFIFLFLFTINHNILLGQFSASSSFIKDETGRTLILHGLNISNYAKYSPNYTSWHKYEDYERMKKEWGFNVVRLLIFWAGIEPEPNLFNETYLNDILKQVEYAEQAGVYVIVDMHQDLYGYKYGGDGAPIWATLDDGIHYEPVSPWWLNYTSKAVMRAFTNFWTNQELQKHYFESFKQVVKKLSSKRNVIGYDLMNEPFFGEFLPCDFEKNILSPFYINLIKELQSIDSRKIYFYEPQIMTSSGINSCLRNLQLNNIAYIPHFYMPTVHEGKPYNGNKTYILTALNRKEIDAKIGKVPWLLGEFGVSEKTEGMGEYLKDILDTLDHKLAGFTYYSYDKASYESFGIIDEEGNEQEQLKYLVRPYPQKIAGTPVMINYSSEKRTLDVDFLGNTSYPQPPTEIYVGKKRIYPEGFVVKCSDKCSWEYDQSLDIVKVWNSPSVDPKPRRITIAPIK